jgi:hypothetical protein
MDYTTSADVFAQGEVLAPTANQTAVMNTIVTAVSRRVDKMCVMQFGQATYTNQRVPIRISVDGLVSLYINSPNLTACTSATIRVGNIPSLLPLNVSNAVLEANDYGSKIQFYGLDYSGIREVSILRAYVSYTAGWASLASIPDDFHLAVTQLAWYTYQQRAAPMNATAVPELGIITLPASIQPYIKDVLNRYTWYYA